MVFNTNPFQTKEKSSKSDKNYDLGVYLIYIIFDEESSQKITYGPYFQLKKIHGNIFLHD